MSDTVIRVQNLSKQYRIGARQQGYKTFREAIVDMAKAPFRLARSLLSVPGSLLSPAQDTIWALRDVSFEVKRGEVVGIIGRNGAGKSTLLKVLSKITEPTEGRAELKGRVGSLLEVGTGFHPELTGHENIYLYGAILGMDRWEVTRKFDDIVTFAELEKFIDTPVKRYSSGMYMRLAFAVAAHLEPEILLIDEVLAVGDAAFQDKCLGKMEDVSKEGRTVLFVSHSMASISSLCENVVLLQKGRIRSIGPSAKIVEEYLASHIKISASVDLRDYKDRKGTGEVRVVEATILDSTGTPCSRFKYNDDIIFEYTLESVEASQAMISVVWVKTATGIPVLHLANHDDQHSGSFKVKNKVKLRCHLKECKLVPGNYFVSFFVAPDHYQHTDLVRDALQFRMEQGELMEKGFDLSWKNAIMHSDSAWSIETVEK